jgi:hypothetical protein
MSPTQFFDASLDLMLAYFKTVQDGAAQELLDANPITKRLARTNFSARYAPLDAWIRSFSTKFYKKVQDNQNILEALLTVGGFLAEQVYFAQELSMELRAPVLLGDYAGTAGKWKALSQSANLADFGQSFLIFRMVLDKEGLPFPPLADIDSALALRSDPHIRAYREQAHLFHRFIMLGDDEASRKLRAEVQRAKSYIRLAGRVTKSVDWVTYATLPFTVIETLIHGLPALGIAMAAYAAGGIIASDQLRHKHGWILMGTR